MTGLQDADHSFPAHTYHQLDTVTVCFISILAGIPAGAYGAGNSYMASRFSVQNQPFPNLYWATTSWNMGAALMPILFVPLLGWESARICRTCTQRHARGIGHHGKDHLCEKPVYECCIGTFAQT